MQNSTAHSYVKATEKVHFCPSASSWMKTKEKKLVPTVISTESTVVGAEHYFTDTPIFHHPSPPPRVYPPLRQLLQVAILSKAILPRQMAVDELGEILEQVKTGCGEAESKYQFVDVREESELAQANLPGK